MTNQSSFKNLNLLCKVDQEKLKNLGDLLHSNPALEVLHIHSNGASLKNHLSSSSPDSGLPAKLKHIIITSETITNLHPAAFKVGTVHISETAYLIFKYPIFWRNHNYKWFIFNKKLWISISYSFLMRLALHITGITIVNLISRLQFL